MDTAADTIIAQVAGITGQPVDAILGKSQETRTVRARYMAMALVYQLTSLSCEEIGKSFDKHATLTYLARKRTIQFLAQDPDFARDYQGFLAAGTITRQLEAHDPRRRGRARRADSAPKPSGRPGRGISVTVHTHGRLDELKEAAVRSKLRQAEENLAYWKMAKASATRPQDRADHAARILIWQGEADAIRRRLRALTRTACL